MATILSQMIDQLKSTGKKILEHPSSITELLNLLDELDRLLSKFGQSPSPSVQEALLVPMRALISDDLIKHSNDDVKVIVASCLNEIMRISAPVAPYDDRKMKEFFELIVFSFEKLSSKSDRSYSKAVSLLESVAKLQSCVMMLDLDCDPLLVKMFELFQKNFCLDHPPSVLWAMETIMSIVVMESDTLSLNLIKVLLSSVRKENEHVAPVSWKVGAKLIEQCMDKIKPYILTALSSMGSCLEDFAPILSSICKSQLDLVNDCVADSDEHMVNTKDTKTKVVALVQCLSASEKSSIEHLHQSTCIGNDNDKKRKLQKNVGPESMDMVSSKSTMRPSKKDKSQTNDASKSRKKQSSVDVDVIETPHGSKRYKEDLVGSRIKVWWPLDHEYYEGKITSYDATTKKHKVNYDDGDEEILNLDKERWEFIGDEILDHSATPGGLDRG